MIEAQIICSAPCDIPDLGIYGLKRGEERWVSDLAASRSDDLRKEKAKGNVRVLRKSRRLGRQATPSRPPPPFVAHSRPSHDSHAHKDRPKAEPAPSVDPEILVQAMKTQLLGELLPDLRATIAQEVGKAMGGRETPETVPQPQAPPQAGMDQGQLEGVLESVLRRVLPSGGSVSAPVAKGRAQEEDEPVFIPSTIVDKDTKGRISVKSESSSETDDLDEAQKALREMKRKRKGNVK